MHPIPEERYPGQTDAGLAHGHPDEVDPDEPSAPEGEEEATRERPGDEDADRDSRPKNDVEGGDFDAGGAVEITPDERGSADPREPD